LKKTILAFALGLSLVGVSAQAETIAFNFSGTWTNSAVTSWFPVNGKFDGSIRYDLVPKSATNTVGPGSYPGELLTFAAPSFAFFVPSPKITIYNAPNGSASDQFVINILENVHYSLNQLPSSLFFISADFSLTGIDNMVFNDTSLPSLDVMTSTLFKPGMFTLSFIDTTGNKVGVLGIIDSITPQPVPEPTTIFLFATGLTSLAARRRRPH